MPIPKPLQGSIFSSSSPVLSKMVNRRATIQNNLPQTAVPRGRVCQVWDKLHGPRDCGANQTRIAAAQRALATEGRDFQTQSEPADAPYRNQRQGGGRLGDRGTASAAPRAGGRGPGGGPP